MSADAGKFTELTARGGENCHLIAPFFLPRVKCEERGKIHCESGMVWIQAKKMGEKILRTYGRTQGAAAFPAEAANHELTAASIWMIVKISSAAWVLVGYKKEDIWIQSESRLCQVKS